MDFKKLLFIGIAALIFLTTQAQDYSSLVPRLKTPQFLAELKEARKVLETCETLKGETQVEKDAALAKVDFKEAKVNGPIKSHLDELNLQITKLSTELDSLTTRTEELKKKIAVLGNVPEIEDSLNSVKKDYQKKSHALEVAQADASLCGSKISDTHSQFSVEKTVAVSAFNAKLSKVENDINVARAEVNYATHALSDQLKKEKEVVRYKELADKDDPAGLRRMSEIYRAGYGVEVDLTIADSYYSKYESVLSGEALEQAKADREMQEKLLKEKFEKNLGLANQFDNSDALVYLEKCYRFGLGTNVDTNKANEYHEKAVLAGAFKQRNHWQ
jgi:TPR repeat protein/chaperonin cofactor prefoldin